MPPMRSLSSISSTCHAIVSCAGLTMLVSTLTGAESWSEPVEVRSGTQRCVSYRVRLQGEYLLVEASHEPAWHTYAMDNLQRATAKLEGREPLGVELPTKIVLGEGLKPVGPWYQTPPTDFSQPEIEWFTWGFEGRARFAVKVQRTDAAETTVRVRGQVCDASSCLSVDVVVPVALTNSVDDHPNDFLDALVVVADERQ